jgi:DNA-binding PadR family transcriptional regulator
MTGSRAFSPQTLKVLRALAAQPQAWRYGYDLMKETGLRSGTLYPLLIRLSDQGLLDSEWRPAESAGRPPRHAYRLTRAGLAAAHAQAARGSVRSPGRGLAAT